jgi:hypothetical protein
VLRCGARDTEAEPLRKPPIPPFRFEIIVDSLRVARSIFCSTGRRFPFNHIVVCPAQNVIDRSSLAAISKRVPEVNPIATSVPIRSRHGPNGENEANGHFRTHAPLKNRENLTPLCSPLGPLASSASTCLDQLIASTFWAISLGSPLGPLIGAPASVR